MRKFLVGILIISLIVGVGSSVLAYGAHGHGMRGRRSFWGTGRAYQALELTESQIDKISELREEFYDETEDLREEMRELRWEIRDERFKNANNKEIGVLLDQIELKAEELRDMREINQLNIERIFTEEQLQIIEDRSNDFGHRFNGRNRGGFNRNYGYHMGSGFCY